MPTFAQIQEEIANMLAIPDEELDDEQKQLMDQYLDELANQEASKIDGFAQFIKLQLNHIEACKEEAKRLKQKAETASKRIDFFKAHYLANMEKYGLKKISGDVYSIVIRENSKVNISNFDALMKDNNPAWVKTEITYKPDKTAIKEALKDGIDVPGCQLEKGFSLNIR